MAVSKSSAYFFRLNSFQLLAVITGVGPEVLVTVEDIEDLDLHIGQLTGHEENYVSIGYIGESL